MFRQRNAGLIMLRKDLEDGGSAELGVAHTTQSMGYGYMSADMASPRARISRKQESDKAAIVAIHHLHHKFTGYIITNGMSILVIRKNKEMLATKAAKAADLKRK
ncbi:hypothetical protein GGH96_000988 [Coemansia sp. RSA 1972]|nr:hypothetical protein GGH96_000988 [Coemansia sp. RSA 1972]